MEGIVFENATKIIKGRPVLSEVSCSLERGCIHGFFGSNGSGKTMLFKAVSGLVRLSSGSISVFGERIGKDVSFPSSLGVVFSSGLWSDLSGSENLRLLASIKGQIGDIEIKETLVRVGLDAEDGRPYRSYSLGMKRRLQIAQAIMESPRLLIMDEPLNSLDSDGLRMLVGILREERSRGTTVLLASHNSSELETLCDRKFRVENGRVSECVL